MAAKTRGDGEEELESEINVIPLVDIMLVLLIIFMVAAPMMNDSVNVSLPKAKAQSSKQEPASIEITMTKENKIFMGKTEVPFESLVPKVQSALTNNPRDEVFIRADEEVTHGQIIRVMASLQRAGIFKVSFITDPRQAQ